MKVFIITDYVSKEIKLTLDNLQGRVKNYIVNQRNPLQPKVYIGLTTDKL